MKLFISTLLVVASLALPGTDALANPNADVCHVRAQKNSGHHGPRRELTTQAGSVKLRLSGSVALGVSRSNRVGGGYNAPAFAGQDATDQRAQKAKDKYSRIYDACMRDQ
jgi:hypothetical protein